MPKYLSGKAKRVPVDRLTEERYKYFTLGEAEPSLGDPLVGVSSADGKTVPPGEQFIVVSVEGRPGERFWIPNQGGVIPGTISVFDEDTLVGGLSSITQLNFVGAGITAEASVVKEVDLTLQGGSTNYVIGNEITQGSARGFVAITTNNSNNSGIVTVRLTDVSGTFNTSDSLSLEGVGISRTPSQIDTFNIGDTRSTIKVTPEFFSENREIIFNDNNEFNGANRFTYNNYSYGSTNLDIVGIGTTLPSIAISTGPAYVFTNDAILDIRGDIRLEGTVYDSNDKDATTKDDDTGDLLIRGENGLIWKDQAGLNVSAGGTVPGQIQFRGLTGLLDGATNFFFDDANDRVGIGTTLPNFTFEVIGDVGIANSLTVNDIVSIAKTVSIASTAENIPGNTGTGALVVTGGVGIGGSVSVGGSVTAAGGFTLVGGLEVEDITGSTSVTTGALIVAGGAGISGDLNVGGDIRPDEIFLKDNKKVYFGDDNDLQIYHASSGIGSTSFIDNNTGHLFIRNNVGSGSSNIYIQAKTGENGIVIQADGTVELYNDNTKRLNTTSTGVQINNTLRADIVNPGSGTVTNDWTVNGTLKGVGLTTTKDLSVTGIATINEIDATHTDTDTLNVGIAATAEKLVVNNVTIDNNVISSIVDLVLDTPSGKVDVNQKLSIDSTEASTSAITGALRVAGGIGIGSNVFSDGTISIGNTTNVVFGSSSFTGGALAIDGGVGIAKSLAVLGDTNITSTTASTSTTTGALVIGGGVGIGESVYIAGTVYADKFNLLGANAQLDITNENDNNDRFIVFTDTNVTGEAGNALVDTDIIYNPSTNTLGIGTDDIINAVSEGNTAKLHVGVVTAHVAYATSFFGNLVGLADRATKLENEREIGINVAAAGNNPGKVKGAGVDFDGTQNISIDGNLMNSGVTSSKYGSTTVFPVVSVNAQGIVTSVTTINFTDIIAGEGNKVAISNTPDSTNTFFVGFVTASSGYGDVKVDNEEFVYIPNTGVGIGSIQPTAKLDVGGTLNVSGNSTLRGQVTVYTGIIPDADEGAYLGSSSRSFSEAHIGEIRIANSGNNKIDTATGNLTLDSSGGTTIIDDKLRVLDNVGIKTTSTTHPLQIGSVEDGIVVVTSSGNVGIGTDDVDIPVTDANTAKLAVGILTAYEIYGATFSGISDRAKTVEIDDVGSTSTLKYLHFGDLTDSYDGVEVDSATLVFKNRNLGIGLNDPTSKLHVDGTSKITGVLTLTSDTNSTNKTTGALVVEHGVGIGSNLTVGETLTVDDKLNVTGVVSFAGPSSGQAVKLATNGGITTTGGDLYVGGDLHVLDDIFYDEISGRNIDITGTATINELKLGSGSAVSVGVTGISTDLSIAADVDEHDLLVTAKAAQSFIASQFDSVTLKFTGDSSNNGTVLLGGDTPQTFLLSGTPNEIVTVGLAQSITIGLPDDVTIGQDLTVSRNLNVNGNTTLGNDVNADTVTFNSKINSNFLPNGNQDIGASDIKWKNVFAETVTANVTGIASTATSLENAQDFSIDGNGNTGTNDAGDVTAAAVSFDGTNDVVLRGKLKNISGLTSGTYGNASTIPVVTVNSQGLVTGVTTESVINIGGNAETASKLNPGSKIGINVTSTGNNAGKVQATGVNFTGEADISIDGNLMDSGVTADIYGDAVTIPIISVNSQGIITGIETSTINSSTFQVEQSKQIQVNVTDTTSNANDDTPYYIGFTDETTNDSYGKFRIDTTNALVYKNGKLGVNNSTPNQTLDVNGNIGIDDYIVHNNDANTRFGFPQNDTFVVETNGTEKLRITSDGNVGIGTETPTDAVTSSNTAKLAVGIVTANEYYGTFKGTLQNEVVATLADKVQVNTFVNTGNDNSGQTRNILFSNGTGGHKTPQGAAGLILETPSSIDSDAPGYFQYKLTIDAVNQSTSGRRTRNLNIFGAGNSSGISLWNRSASGSVQANAIRTDDEGNFVVELNDNPDDVGFIISDSATTVNGKKYFNAGIGTDNPDADAVHPDNSARFMAGIVTAREYYGTFKGTLENTVVSSLVTINGDGDNGGDTGTHYIHMGSQTSGSDGVEVDSTGLVYKNKKLGIGTDDSKELLDVYSAANSTISVRSGNNDFSSIGLVEASTSSSNSFGNSGSFGFRLGYDGSTNRFKIASGENTTINDRLVISRGDGNVSIGDPNPDADTVSASNTARLMVGIVTANEYYGEFKGTTSSQVITGAGNATSNVTVKSGSFSGTLGVIDNFASGTTTNPQNTIVEYLIQVYQQNSDGSWTDDYQSQKILLAHRGTNNGNDMLIQEYAMMLRNNKVIDPFEIVGGSIGGVDSYFLRGFKASGISGTVYYKFTRTILA